MSFFRHAAVAASFAIAAAAGAPAFAAAPSATITIDDTQFGFLVGGSTGGGVLHFEGKSYPFKISGLSVGNIGVSKVRGAGEVYGLKSVADFAGTYSRLEASATALKGAGTIRLKNDKGVELKIESSSKGLQLSASGGGVKISLK